MVIRQRINRSEEKRAGRAREGDGEEKEGQEVIRNQGKKEKNHIAGKRVREEVCGRGKILDIQPLEMSFLMLLRLCVCVCALYKVSITKRYAFI